MDAFLTSEGLLALVTLVAKTIVEFKAHHDASPESVEGVQEP